MPAMYESIVELLEASCVKFANRPVFGRKQGGGWDWITYAQFDELVRSCMAGLAQLGVGPEDRVGLVADNCVEWATVAHATYARGAVFVPMYTAQPVDEWKFVLRDSGIKVVFAASEREYEVLAALVDQLPALEAVVGLSLPEGDARSYGALLARGRAHPIERHRPKADAIAGCVYTSGTTGEPKGVELSHRNICSNCAAVCQVLRLEGARTLAFLPWAHVFGQTAELHSVMHDGGCLAINDDVKQILPNLAEVSPTALIAVPRIFNRIYDGVNRQMSEKPAIIRALFRNALRLAERRRNGLPLKLGQSVILALADWLIFSKVRARFGGKLVLAISGSAALNPEVARFLEALGIIVYEGYGLTETSPIVSVNYPGHRKIGSVGKPLPGVRVLIDESSGDSPGEGEIIVYGPNVMVGYHDRSADTAAVSSADGGFRTGDLGRLDEDGFLYITGRLKELYKLENGKYVAPCLLEEQLKLSPLIANALVYGENKPNNVALIVADSEGLRRWAESNGTSLGDVSRNPRVKALLMEEVVRYSSSFKSFQRPRDIAVIADDFTAGNGMLTPKMSVKRGKVLARYQPVLDALYRAPAWRSSAAQPARGTRGDSVPNTSRIRLR